MEKKFTIYDSWKRFGLTKHWGGIGATEKLIGLCGISPGMRVLEVGCGTGYTACLLAKKYNAHVTAIDITPKVLEQARKRIAAEGLEGRVKVIEADVHKLPFRADTFDAAIAESVLFFCEREKAISEIHRVLKQGGFFGANESTLLKPLPPGMHDLFSESFGGKEPLAEGGWRAIIEKAGFVNVASAVYKASPFKQFIDELRIDGLQRVFAFPEAISDPAARKLLFDMDMWKKGLGFFSYVGYGLYAGRKK